MKIRILLLTLITTSSLYANTSVGTSSKFKSNYRDDQTSIETVKKLINDSTKNLEKNNPKQYVLNLKQASNFKSGLASFKLATFMFNQLIAKNDKYNFSELKKYSLIAAEYGFPQAYDFIGQAYSHGLDIAKDTNLGTCYSKATNLLASKDFIGFCEKTYPSFELSPNKGYTFAFEEQMQTNDLYENFCNSDNNNLLNPTFSEDQNNMLRAKICDSSKNVSKHFKNGDLVLKGKGVKEFKDGTYINYQAPLTKGQIVYKINSPTTRLVYDGNVLRIPTKGTKIITTGKSLEI